MAAAFKSGDRFRVVDTDRVAPEGSDTHEAGVRGGGLGTVVQVGPQITEAEAALAELLSGGLVQLSPDEHWLRVEFDAAPRDEDGQTWVIPSGAVELVEEHAAA